MTDLLDTKTREELGRAIEQGLDGPAVTGRQVSRVAARLLARGWLPPVPAMLTAEEIALEDPRVLRRIAWALQEEESPAPWIQRAFDALSMAQGNAAKVEKLQRHLAYHHDDLNRLRSRASIEQCDDPMCIEARGVRDTQNEAKP